MSGKLIALVGMVVVSSAGADSIAGPRAGSIELLESMLPVENPASLKVWLNDAGGASDDSSAPGHYRVTLGQSREFHFRSSTEVYLTAIHIDSQGVTTLLFPTAREADGHLRADKVLVFPARDEIAIVTPPLGPEDLFVFGTRQPLPLTDLKLSKEEASYPIFDEESGPPFVTRLREVLRERSDTIGAARLQMVVQGRDRTRYLATEIVAYYTAPRSRSLSRVRLDLPVTLGPQGNGPTQQTKQDLDEFAAALEHGDLVNRSFLVLGPQPQATYVVTYLTEVRKISAERLTIKETETGSGCRSEEPRIRCVEFQLDRTR